MSLFLYELEPADAGREGAVAVLDSVAQAADDAGAALLESTVSGEGARVFAVVEAPDAGIAGLVGRKLDHLVAGPDEVRLVGADIEDVRAARGEARFLVEWDFPEDLTMDAYLARKKANAPKYADVPEVSFLRTYVREDMDKCLCLYDAGSEDDVRRAREAVGAPVSRVHELGGASVRERA
jgi:hypothetical protein